MRSLAVLFFAAALCTSAFAQKPRPVRPKPAATPKKPLSEQAEWTRVTAIEDRAKRIEGLRKFVEQFPKAARLTEALEMLSGDEAALAAEKLQAGDAAAAAALFTSAAEHAPQPVAEKLWSEHLSAAAPNLFFRGARSEAMTVAGILEKKAEANAAQLLDIAAFHLSIENGADAKRIAQAAIKLDANSAAAYQTLGLANRMEFDLEGSAEAFAKALELDPESVTARRGLAEMKRSLGKADEAAALYRELLAKDEANAPARTGLILSLFDSGARAEAEAELAKVVEAGGGSVILLAGAAYWYAVHNEGARAVDLAQKAIAAEPRFIWGHIALARGQLAQGRPVDAEKTLLLAQRYGNFPTLDYELASARMAAGLYRDAADDLARSFTVADGVVKANLGGRVPRESRYFTELVGFERRASIFAPTAADDPATAAQMRALLEFHQQLAAAEPNAEALGRAADEFIRGDDRMRVHRELFAASQLLEKKVMLDKAVEITRAAPKDLEAGLDVPEAATAVLASELYESRRIASARGDYVNVPAVPRSMLSSVLRGRIEEITGWALFQKNDVEQAAIHLRRAVSVLPADSSYWRSSMWRLGTALAAAGNDAGALEAYVRSYKAGAPDPIKYSAVAGAYRRVNGNTNGLEAIVGPDPSAATAQAAATPEAPPTPEPSPAAVTADATPTPPRVVPMATPVVQEVQAEATPEASPTPTPEAEAATPSPSPTPEASPTPTPEAGPETPAAVATPVATLEVPPTDDAATPTPEASPSPAEMPPTPTPSPSPAANGLFPPVVITIPAPAAAKASPTPAAGAQNDAVADARPRVVDDKPKPAVEIRPCTITVSDESLTLRTGGGDLAVIVGRSDNNELDGLTAASTSPGDVAVRRQPIDGVRTRALFVVSPVGEKPGVFQVRFEMPCGRREIVVRIQ